MKKPLALALSLISVFAVLFLTSCKEEHLVIKESDTYIVLTVSSKQLPLTKETTLLEYMSSLKEDGLLDFEINGGMITSINGIENPSDWSSCWMIFSNDLEYSSLAFGSIEYQGKTYQSAVLGAESLPVKDGAVYIWIFKAF